MSVQITEEHRAKAHTEAREILARVMNGDPAPERALPAPKKPVRRQVDRLRSRPGKYDRREIRRLFEDEGMAVKAIAEKLGAHRSTISIALTEAGVALGGRRGPYTRWEKCAEGHSMKENWRPNRGGKGGGHCIICKRRRDRESKRATYIPVAERP